MRIWIFRLKAVACAVCGWLILLALFLGIISGIHFFGFPVPLAIFTVFALLTLFPVLYLKKRKAQMETTLAEKDGPAFERIYALEIPLILFGFSVMAILAIHCVLHT